MLLNNMSLVEIEILIENACRAAIEALPNLDERCCILKFWDKLNDGIIDLKTLFFAGDLNPLFAEKIARLKFIQSLLFDMLMCHKKIQDHCLDFSFVSEKINQPRKISIGINGMQTEYINHAVTRKLKDFLQSLELHNSLVDLHEFIYSLLSLANEGNPITPLETQLFYADLIYDNFDKIIKNFFIINQKRGLSYKEISEINFYTWVGGDQDGIPFTTKLHTEAILQAFRNRIKEHYLEDAFQIIQKYQIPKLKNLIEIIEKAVSPEEIYNFLTDFDYANYPEIYLFYLKLKTFGLHYIELEFRENSKIIHESLSQLIDKRQISKILSVKKEYSDLSENEKELLLSHLISKDGESEKIINQFLEKNANLFSEKSIQHQGKTVYDIYESDYPYIIKYNTKRFLDWFFLIEKNLDAINKFGIAETKSFVDILAILFFVKGILKDNPIHIVIQPEGPDGAKNLYRNIIKLYQNDIYMDFLKRNKMVQYITFGPSDICKQGGKGMHLSNMQLANIHRKIAYAFGVNVIPSIVIGYEHARCNNNLQENIREYGCMQSSEIRYMLAGLNEMRHSILSPNMIQSFFNELYLSQFLNSSHSDELEIYQDKFNFWIKTVDFYEAIFFKQPHLPHFLKKIARLDIIRHVTNDIRPQSRKYWLENAEEDPSQIRAVAWIRSLLLAGLHFEWIGAESLISYSMDDLNKYFHGSKIFNQYIKSIAYSCARTNLKFTWQYLQSSVPNLTELKILAAQKIENNINNTKQLLASIHLSYLKSFQLAFMAIYKENFSIDQIFEMDRLTILTAWPDLQDEVRLREKHLDFYYDFVINYKGDKLSMISNGILKNIYSALISESNIATSMYVKQPILESIQ